MNFERENFVNEYIGEVTVLLEKHEKALEETLKKALGFTEYGKTADLDLFDESNAKLIALYLRLKGWNNVSFYKNYVSVGYQDLLKERN